MEQAPLVSIVVPVYNQEKYLDAAYACLAGQSYPSLEFVMVNDGSTDTSLQMLQRYAQADARVKIVDKCNGGLVDATLAGIAAATGEYLCFLDPDDLLGSDHIRFFMDLMRDDCDFVAAGIYTENSGILNPIFLREDRFYPESELRQLSNVFFYDPAAPDAPNRFYNSRCNKLYRTELVKKIAAVFCEFKHISLGEDTLFTYLLLQHSRGGRTVARCNSYFYNIGNINSMTKSEKIDQHFTKAAAVFEALRSLTQRYGTDVSQAYALYENQINVLFARMPDEHTAQFDAAHIRAEQDPVYREALARRGVNIHKVILKSKLRGLRPVVTCIRGAKAAGKHLKQSILNGCLWLKTCAAEGPAQATCLLRQKTQPADHTALIRQLLPLVQSWLPLTTDLHTCPIEKKLFLLRWEGFDKLSPITHKCIASAIRAYPDHTPIQIDQNNYTDYTDIDPQLQDALTQGKLPHAAFTDLLRFNLLKNNGGVVIDCDLFFPDDRWNLTAALAEKSFATVATATDLCLISYMAARKGSLLVRAVDAVTQAYYHTYGTLPANGFARTLLQLLHEQDLDNGVLRKAAQTGRDPHSLQNLLYAPYDPSAIAFFQGVPQYLPDNAGDAIPSGTFYEWILQ